MKTYLASPPVETGLVVALIADPGLAVGAGVARRAGARVRPLPGVAAGGAVLARAVGAALGRALAVAPVEAEGAHAGVVAAAGALQEEKEKTLLGNRSIVNIMRPIGSSFIVS